MPLVTEAFNWQHGTFLGATASSETTAAAAGKVGQLRRDPMAMLPFCGYHMGDYFAHWLEDRQAAPARSCQDLLCQLVPHRTRKGFLWPGYGENSRVLKWIFERCDEKVHAIDTPIGRLPEPSDLDQQGLDLPAANLARLLSVDVDGWREEIPLIEKHFAQFGSHLPEGLKNEVRSLAQRLESAKKK